MPKIRILSDLHLEFEPEIYPPSDQADITILAGDIFRGNKACPWDDAREFFKSPIVLMIMGNHEFYEGKIDTAVAKLRPVATQKGITILDNEGFEADGVRILGTTLWTDFKLFAGNDIDAIRDDANYCVGSRYGAGMQDFRKIRVAADGFRKFRPLDAAKLCLHSVTWLDRELSQPFAGQTIVVTHHAPSAKRLPENLQTDRFSCSYASNLDWLIEKHQPNFWISGHIHEAVTDFRIGLTLMISNPMGCSDSMNPNFDMNYTIEVPEPKAIELNKPSAPARFSM
jgi:hypothetical protein